MKTRSELLLLMVGTFSLGGCTSDLAGAPCPCAPGWCCWGAEGCKSGPDCDVKIAFVPKASNNPVFRLALEGASQAARALSGEAFGFNVEVKCVSPLELDAANQAAAVAQAIASRPSGLVVSCLNEDELNPLIASASDQGIPVITYDSDCPHSGRMAFYGTDNRLTGSSAADLLLEAMFATEDNGPKHVAILSGNRDAENLQAREDGFRGQLLTRHPNVQVAPTYYCNETPQDCGRLIEDAIITGTPELDGLFVMGLWGLQSACTCDEGGLDCRCDDDSLMPKWKAAAKGKLETVACDTLPFELTLVKDGYVSALISQDYFNWGYMSVTLMFQHLTQGRVVKNFVEALSTHVDSESVNEMLSRWEDVEFGPELASVCEVPRTDE